MISTAAAAAADTTTDPLEPGRPLPMLGWLRGRTVRARRPPVPIWARVALSIAVTIGLGTWGFAELKPRLGFFQCLYSSIKLYALDLGPASGSGGPHPNWQIWVALVLAALLVLRAVLALARDRLRALAMRRVLRGHVIVCGAGVHGTALVSALAGGRGEEQPGGESHDVVVVDIDPGSLGMRSARARYEWRRVGDSVLEETLISAGVSRAHAVFAISGNDFVNSQVISAIHSLAAQGRIRDRLHALVQVEDPSLARFLEEETRTPARAQDGPTPVVSPFSANAIAAETLMHGARIKRADGSPGKLMEVYEGKSPNLLLAGNHPLLDALVLAILRHWRVEILRDAETGRASPRPPLHVSVLGPDAATRVDRLRRLWRPESHVLSLEGFDSGAQDAQSGDPGMLHRKAHEWLRMPDRAEHGIIACTEELDGVRLTLEISRALGDSVLLTRVTTELGSAIDKHISDRTKQSSELAATDVESVAKLACEPSKMRRLGAELRLADAISEQTPPQPDPAAASHALFARDQLGLHSDSSWRVVPCEQPLVQSLVDPVRLSALVRAGLTIDLASPDNLRSAAKSLAEQGRAADALSAWCEYARFCTPEALSGLIASLGELDADDLGSRILRLRAFTLGAAEALTAPRREHLIVAARVAIFAGAAGSMPLATAEELEPFLTRALIGYDGVILSGGTNVGVPGVIGRVARAHDLQIIGYVPRDHGDAELYGRLRETEGTDFSQLEPLAMWDDILGSGISARNVRVVVSPGNEITIFEIQLARALGASIAWLDPAGDEPRPLEDILPLGAEPVLEPPADPMTIRAFLTWSSVPKALREPLAEQLHRAYRRSQRRRKPAGDPALAPWYDLIPALRRSNLAQADDIPNKLALVGKRLAKSGDRLVLSDEQVELLAEVEHGRYNIERLAAGWQLGERQVARGVSPYLKPWSELDQETRDYDREAVRNIDPALRKLDWGVTDSL